MVDTVTNTQRQKKKKLYFKCKKKKNKKSEKNPARSKTMRIVRTSMNVKRKYNNHFSKLSLKIFFFFF